MGTEPRVTGEAVGSKQKAVGSRQKAVGGEQMLFILTPDS
jgi:hypothetical protein